MSMEPETIKAIVALVFAFLLVAFVVLQFKIAEPIELEAPEEKLPDGLEVLGKDLPIGFRFMKDGDVIEVVKGKCSKQCVYCGCEYPNKMPHCWKEHVIFKKITDGSEN